MLQLPALALALLLAILYGTLFYLWQRRGLRHLLYYWLAAVVGFALGQLVGERVHLIPWTLGQLHLVEASASSVLVILAAHWLKPPPQQP